jgi:hypothetical protein
MTSFRTILPQLLLLGIFGLWLPLQKGISFLDPMILGAYACLGVVFSAPSVASGAPVSSSVRNGLLLSWLMLLCGIAAIYLTRTVPFGPNLASLAECGLFGVALSTAASLVVAFTAKRASPGTAKVVARLLLLALLAVFYFWSGWLTEVALMGAAISAGVAGLFALLLRRN